MAEHLGLDFILKGWLGIVIELSVHYQRMKYWDSFDRKLVH